MTLRVSWKKKILIVSKFKYQLTETTVQVKSNFFCFCLEKPETEILWAAENGRLDLLKNLVTKNPGLVKVKDRDGYTPLHRACYNNHSEVVEVFKLNSLLYKFYFYKLSKMNL